MPRGYWLVQTDITDPERAWSAGSLIVFRVLPGIGGGVLTPVRTIIIARAAGPNPHGSRDGADGCAPAGRSGPGAADPLGLCRGSITGSRR